MDAFARPYVVSWNLTYRCNLACEHCYLDAGGKPLVAEDAAFADRSELSTEECFGVVDEIAAFAPESLTILTGGEPLLRRDILEIVRYAHGRGLWVVVGTNGVKITETLASLLKREGVRGLSLSLDALDPGRHDLFRRVRGAWENTVQGAKILARAELPFIVQTTVGAHNVGELSAIADFAYEELGAKVWNLYFLVPTGRGGFVSDIAPEAYDGVMLELQRIQHRYAGRMIVNAKCAPHYVRTLLEHEPDSPALKAYAGGAGGCPAGTHYLGIRPNGDVTPCPYLPLFGGNLRKEALTKIWGESDLFIKIRDRALLGGRCGACELGGRCGGCRARAYGATGDVMAEDPLCTHTPGTFASHPALKLPPPLEYGAPAATSISWTPEAEERMKRVPAFVRGMVVRAVESHCQREGIALITAEILDDLRARMPSRARSMFTSKSS
ncbi:MAG TPA: radical SAM protein [Candidatus Polarisedimenticolaceae bacterium]|nr:radical SAM protein [Candidatus Polarisedimenticolaceae bacterium]